MERVFLFFRLDERQICMALATQVTLCIQNVVQRAPLLRDARFPAIACRNCTLSHLCNGLCIPSLFSLSRLYLCRRAAFDSLPPSAPPSPENNSPKKFLEASEIRKKCGRYRTTNTIKTDKFSQSAIPGATFNFSSRLAVSKMRSRSVPRVSHVGRWWTFCGA